MTKWLLALALLTALSASAATITGTVTNDAAQPLAGITVQAWTADGVLFAAASTNASGAYSLTTGSGSYRVLAFDPSGAYATSFYADADSFETSRVLTGSATNVNFRLVRAGFASGRVTGPTGAVLAKITVAAYNPSGTRRGFTTTDTSGNYTLSLPPGSYQLAAYDEALGYATVVSSVSIAPFATSTASFQLPAAARLSGLVTDRATGAPLAAMRVVAYASDGTVAGRTTTGSDGRYALAIRPDAVRVVVDDPAGVYAATYAPDAPSFAAATPVVVSSGTTVNATLARAGHLAGRALPGLTAVAYNADGSTRAFATADASGAFSIVVPPGDYRVGVFDPALVYLPQFWPGQPSFAAATVVHVVASQTVGALDFTPAMGGRVTGRVLSTATGAPLAAMTVVAYDAFGQLVASAPTDAAGNYTLLAAPATVTIVAFDPALGFAASAPRTLTLAAGATQAADFALADAGRLFGTASPAGVAILVYDAGFTLVAQTTTDAAGNFRVAVPAGTYTVAAADPAHHYATAFYPTPLAVGAHIDVGPLQFHLTAAAAPGRRRATR